MIRRPMLYGVAAFVSAIFICFYCNRFVAFGPAVVLLVAGMRYERKFVLWILLFFYLFSLVNVVYHQSRPETLRELAGERTQITGKILMLERKQGHGGEIYMQLKMDVDAVSGHALKDRERILLQYYDTPERELLPGSRITAAGSVELPAGRRNPKCFDYSLYLASMGIHTIMKAEKIICQEPDSLSFQSKLFLRKEKYLQKLEAAAGEKTAAMMRAMLFGEKGQLDEDLLEAFRRNGIAHILAVSGLHTGIVYGFLSLIWRWKKGWLFFGLVSGVLLCYMVLAACSPSVVRAVFMIMIHAFARLTNRRYDLSSAAFLVAICMLVKNPMQLFHVGFQMSFLAILAMALIIPMVKRIYSGVFLAGIAVQLGLLPYTAYTFNYFSLCAVLLNVPVIFLAGILVPAGLCALVLMEFCEPLFHLMAGILSGLCRMLESINAVTGVDGLTVWTVTSPPGPLVAVYYLALPVFLSEEGRLMLLRKQRKLASLCAVCVLAAALFFGQVTDSPLKDADVIFVDVGQGDCIHFKSQEGGNYLVDGGGSAYRNVGRDILKPYLLKNGVGKIDGAFVTHLHTDHYKGIAELCREGMVTRLFLYEGNRVREEEILKETGLEKDAIVYLAKGEKIRLSKEVCAEVLWPEKKTKKQYEEMLRRQQDENESSLILKVRLKHCSVMATADVNEACQDLLARLWNGNLKADVLKVAHHGSRYSYSEEFTDAVAPRYAVFQVEKIISDIRTKELLKNILETV